MSLGIQQRSGQSNRVVRHDRLTRNPRLHSSDRAISATRIVERDNETALMSNVAVLHPRIPGSCSAIQHYTNESRAIAMVPAPRVIFRALADPLRTTRARPSASLSPVSKARYSSTSTFKAVAIMLRAPSLANSSSVIRNSSGFPLFPPSST